MAIVAVRYGFCLAFIHLSCNYPIWIERAFKALQKAVNFSISNFINSEKVCVVFALDDSFHAAIIIHQIL